MVSLSRNWKYDVFPSFCGGDVRKGFLSHLLEKLKSKEIRTFIDDEIKRGQPIGPELVKGIRESRVAIVLLSSNYPSSSWCLDELVEIMKGKEKDQDELVEIMERDQQKVISIFHEVDPSDVRKQIGYFGKAFDITCVEKEEKVKQAWRQALKDIAGIAGYDTRKWQNEADLINKIVIDLMDLLGVTKSNDFVGMKTRIKKINSMLSLQSDDVKIIGIVGAAGTGKTTTARELYNQLSPDFQFSTFIEMPSLGGSHYQYQLDFQEELLSRIFNQKDTEVGHLGVAEEKLRDKKVLVVLDEVDCLFKLEAMAKRPDWFGPGSRIIVTSQDRNLLKKHNIKHNYKIGLPDDIDSFQIFCQYAFGQKSPFEGFEELAWEVTGLAGRLPLGLRIMGSYLRGLSKDEWIEELLRLRSSIDGEIESLLRFSYDALRDNEKALFLHIACFFDGYEVDRFQSFLANSCMEVNFGLQVLARKSLISIEHGYIRMHSLLEKMGREIVKKEYLEEPGKRKFLMDTSDISQLLHEETGTGNVLGIMLSTSGSEDIHINRSAFQGMNNLQLLKVHSKTLCIPEGLNCFPEKLRLLDWKDCPLTFWPSKFSFEFLVELIMEESNFEKLWEGIKPLPCFKRMNLSNSQYLKEIPDLSEATSLEKLNLSGCESLLELTSSIGNATKLRVCNLRGCLLLKKLPSSIGMLINLEVLDITGCSHIEDFPNVSDSVVELVLSCTGIEEVPPWIEKLFRLRKLIMNGCKNLKISPKVSKLENLEFLSLCIGFCEHDEDEVDINTDVDLYEAVIKWGTDMKRSWRLRSDYNDIFPICLPKKAFTSPISLHLSSCGFKTIPDCISHLSGLIKLDVTGCRELIALPPLPGSLLSIDAEDCLFLERIDSSFQNPKICLNFTNCFSLNQKSRSLILTSACRYALLPGQEVPAHFSHQSTSNCLTINLTPRSFPSSFRFKACILLSKGNIDLRDSVPLDVDDSFVGVTCCVRGKQNGLTVGRGSNQVHMPDLYGRREHMYVFEDSFTLNQDCPEAEETTFSELSFVLRFHDKGWKVKGCGVRLLQEVTPWVENLFLLPNLIMSGCEKLKQTFQS